MGNSELFDQNHENYLLQQIIKYSKNKLKDLTIEIGGKFCKRGDLPKGILIIKEGVLRVTLKTCVNQEIFTVQTLKKGQMAGIDQILRSSKDSEITASTSVRGYFLDCAGFLQILRKDKKFLACLNQITRYEYYSTLSNFLYEEIKKCHLLFESYESSTINKVNLLFPGTHHLEKNFDKYIVSSSNIEGFGIGEIIEGPLSIDVVGKLPARIINLKVTNNALNLISKSKNLMKNNNPLINSEIMTSDIREQAFEDYFGPRFEDSSYPHISGQGLIQESIACLRMITRFFDMPFKKDITHEILQDQINRSKNRLISLPQFASVFELLGFKVSPIKVSNTNLLSRLNFPAIALVNNRPIVIWELESNKLILSDPKNGQYKKKTKEFLKDSEKNLYILILEKVLNNETSSFGINWFFPILKKHKTILFQVFIASFFVQLLALFNPLLIQQIFDAVISQGNISSLNVLGTILISMALAQALLGSLRTFLFSDTTNRIDINLGSNIIHHLFRLPINYFSKRSVGELNGRINELEKIRRFLTSTAITIFLDAIFSIIYLAVMLLYSVKLTLMTLSILPLFILITIVISPINKRQLRVQAESKALVQSHLVESLNGIETIKGQGMELNSQWRWEQLYSRQIKNSFKNVITNTAAGSISQFLSQLSGLIVIWGGAMLVLRGEMTLGQLIAFRILSGYVTTPILRLTSIWQNFQDIALSVERLGDIIDNRKENDLKGNNLPPLKRILGSVSYDSINFRFNNTNVYQLSDINFKVKQGDFVALIGSSGSGKSTLIKLLMGLYNPESGSIKIDGNDISKFDLYSLRNQLGFVPQETFLFSGTIQSNIAQTRPEANFEEIREAAIIANADEFIQKLSKGYSNEISERGLQLSGGQKQRLSIARMILKNPRIVILDEATSSLDSENEKIVLMNLRRKFQNKTVFFVTHKLENMELFSKILVMEKGKIIEQGTHQELLNLNGRYNKLVNK